ncbi:hypothetical protein EV401DRAFT_2200472 [Pisolithus croceorrhizus]|nr:hypothetical protein EV401DRAFT_2200472 [Pisolithus croceorrhizus]
MIWVSPMVSLLAVVGTGTVWGGGDRRALWASSFKGGCSLANHARRTATTVKLVAVDRLIVPVFRRRPTSILASRPGKEAASNGAVSFRVQCKSGAKDWQDPLILPAFKFEWTITVAELVAPSYRPGVVLRLRPPAAHLRTGCV